MILKYLYSTVRALARGIKTPFSEIPPMRLLAMANKANAQIDAAPESQRRTVTLMAYLGFYWANADLLPGMCKREGSALLRKKEKQLEKMNFQDL